MQNRFRRKELVSPPYDKCGIFAEQDLEFDAGDLIGSEHRQECLKHEARKLGASHGQAGSNDRVRLADQPGVGPRGSLECKGLARVCSSRSNCSSECHPVAVTPIVAQLRRCASERPQPDTFVIDAKQFRKAPDRCVWVRL